MYEKNCLNARFLSHVERAYHVIMLQMHPSSQQEKADVFAEVYAIDTQASIHTLHAQSLSAQDHPCIDMLLTGVKGPSCAIVCSSYDTFVLLLRMFAQKADHVPCSVTGAKHFDSILDPTALTVLAKKALQWDDVYETTHSSSCMMGSLHVHVDECVCDFSVSQEALAM